MTGRTHLLAGAAAGVAASGWAHAGMPAWLAGAAGAAAALIPDTDTPHARIWAVLAPLGLAAGAWAAGRFGLPGGPATGAAAGLVLTAAVRWTFPAAVGHRGVMHSVLALAAFVAAAWWLAGRPLAAVAAAGYGSHLLLDAMTPAGVPLFWPLPGRARILGGRVPEWALLAVSVAIASVWLSRWQG